MARLRFCPSPAGNLHVGHIRNAVLTWILARQVGGDYFVRFENTDRAKEVPGARQAIIEDLEWLGLLGPEPPHDQAEMTDSYSAALDSLASTGHTYRDGNSVRFRTPTGGTVSWDDLVRGPVSVRNGDLDDPVLVRTSGEPTFYLASTVDDIDDGVTHMLRPDVTLRMTATQIHLWRSLDTEPPLPGHIPLVVGPRGRPVRMSTAEATVRALRSQGITPTALLLYLAMPAAASWKVPPCSLEEITDRVDFGRLSRRPITFDLRALQLLDRRYRSLA
jgi:glutamyl-tRNA synthetase